MIDSGLRLEVLERDSASGYSRVRTPGGTEGWVLSRYLMSEPSAREQLEKLTSQLTTATSRGSSLDTQMKAITAEYDSANELIKKLEARESSGGDRAFRDQAYGGECSGDQQCRTRA